MTWDPAQLVTLALAVVGAFGTATKAVEKVAPTGAIVVIFDAVSTNPHHVAFRARYKKAAP